MAVTKWLPTLLLWITASAAYAAILPEQRADILYHSYDGGGVTIDGPSVLVRKNINEKFSFSANYYVDMVTSASIDVLVRSEASSYTEERTETSIGVDYLNDRTIMGITLANSSENDYEANTFAFSLSQEFFGDLSTLTMAFILGDDTVRSSETDDFESTLDRKRYSIGFSQILSKKLIASFSYETVIDEGFLRNPYRSVRGTLNGTTGFITPGQQRANGLCENDDLSQAAVGSECYPETRNSESFAVRGIYSLTPRSSIRAEYRVFSDSWGVESDNIELRYSRRFGNRWLIELRARQYNQDKGADFYRDFINFGSTGTVRPTFFARDKELSQYSSQQLGLGISYTFKSRNEFLNNSTLSFHWDHITFDYDDFRDFTEQANGFAPGEEPLYSLDADVIRVFFSAYF
ncbi:MAG: DUF3570 domain-containing protein [Cellvibrionaceae bacterium]